MNFTIPYDAISSGPGGYRGLVCRRSGWISRYDPGHWDVAPTAADAGRLSPWQQPRCTHRGDAHMQTRPACTWKPVHAVARIRCFVHTLHTNIAATVPSPSRNNPVRLKAPFNEKEPFQRTTSFRFSFSFSTPSFPYTNYRGNPFN